MFPYSTPSQPNYMDADPMQGMIKPAQYPVMGLTPPTSFDNMNSPNSNMNMGQMSPYATNSYSTPQYARGGSVRPRGLMQQAQDLRQYGQGGDDILAHINPEEAMMLAQHSGGDINPYTGLPQFGWWTKIRDKVVGGAKKYALPIIGRVVGTAIGGPIGGHIGASIGGSIGHPNQRLGAGKAAMMSMMYDVAGKPFGLPGAQGMGANMNQLGNMFGSTGLGNMFGGGQGVPGSGGLMSSLGNMFGGGGNAAAGGVPRYSADVVGKAFNGSGVPSQYLLNGPSSSGGGGFMQGIGNILGGGGQGATGGQGGVLGSIGNILGGGQSSGGGGLGSLLGGGDGLNNALLATSLIGSFKGKEKSPREESPEEMMEYAQRKWRPEDYDRNIPKVKRQYRPAPLNYRPGIDPEHSYIDEYEEEKPVNKYRGGRIDMSNGGYLDGDTGGHADKIKANLADGEYVLSADVVSHLGDGNNRHGAKKLDAFMKNVRSHKATKGFPPKAKGIGSYMQKTRRV